MSWSMPSAAYILTCRGACITMICPSTSKLTSQPGYQLLDGNGAMGVLRWRHNSDDSGHILNSGYAMGDLGRIKTQQAFLKEVVRKCLQPMCC